jgi:hypothetical protein
MSLIGKSPIWVKVPLGDQAVRDGFIITLGESHIQRTLSDHQLLAFPKFTVLPLHLPMYGMLIRDFTPDSMYVLRVESLQPEPVL